MIRYLYNRQFVFVGEIEVDEFQSFPHRSTVVVPPALTEGEYAVFTGVDWEIITDLPVTPVTVPQTVTLLQAKLAIDELELDDMIDNAIAALPRKQNREAAKRWSHSVSIRRDSELLIQILTTSGMNDSDIDALFTLAATL